MDLPQPITREELYLAYYVGLRGFALPPEPATRIELYLAKLCGKQSVQLPSRPVTNAELYLAKLCGEDVQLPAEPILRVDFYLAKLCGEDVQLPPEPYTKTEAYLAFAATSEVSEVVILGEMSTIEDTLEGIGFSEVQLLGDSFQETYTGKNKFGAQQASTTLFDVTTTISDGLITLDGTTKQNGNIVTDLQPVNFIAKANTTYTITGRLVSGSLDIGDHAASIYLRKADGSSIANAYVQIGPIVSDGFQSHFFTVTEDTPCYLRVYGNSAGIIFDDLVLSVQVEEGNESTSFEPYVGGITAPNPDYPQDIQVVTGEQTVKVTGKNLFNKDSATIIGGYINAQMIFKASAVSGQQICIPCSPNTTYTVSKTNAGNNPRFCVFTTENTLAAEEPVLSLEGTRSGNDSATSYTITTPANAHFLSVFFRAQNTSMTAAEILDTLQIEKAATASDYQPYQSQSYEINLGKNLLDATQAVLGTIDSSTGEIVPWSGDTNMAGTNYIKVSPNTKYTLSSSSKFNSLRFNEYTNDKTHIQRTQAQNSKEYTITTTENTHYVRWSANYNGQTITNPQELASTKQMQIEAGVATTYAAYFTPIELVKIGDYQDYLWTDGEKWWKHKAVGKASFDASSDESWIRSGQSSSSVFVGALNNMLSGGFVETNDNGATSLNDHFTFSLAATSPAGTWRFNDNSSGASAYKYLLLRMDASIITTIEDFTAWLADNPVTVYYPLTTPTDEEITNETLISQLNALANSYGYAGQTNFFITAEDPNLPTGLKLKVRRAV